MTASPLLEGAAALPFSPPFLISHSKPQGDKAYASLSKPASEPSGLDDVSEGGKATTYPSGGVKAFRRQVCDLPRHILDALGRLSGMSTRGVPWREVFQEVLESLGVRGQDLKPDELVWAVNPQINHACRGLRAPFRKGPGLVQEAGGHWGLTAQGLKFIRKARGHEPMPSPEICRDALILSLGKLTGYQEGVGVSSKKVTLQTAEGLGYGPKSLPEGWAWGGKQGLSRKINLAFRGMRARYCKADGDLCILMGDKSWGLTGKGVLHARTLANMGDPDEAPPSMEDVADPTPELESLMVAEEEETSTGLVPGENETSKWIEENYATFWPALVQGLGRKMQKARQMGTVEDHAQNFLVKMIRLDMIAKCREKGEKIRVSNLIYFARNSASNDIRKEGRDPHCRSFRGTRTTRELTAKQGESGGETVPVSRRDPRVAYQGDGLDGGEMVRVLVDLESEGRVAQEVRFNSLFDQIEQLVKESKPKDWAKYCGVVSGVAAGMTYTEIAQKEDLNPDTVSRMFRYVRDLCRTEEGKRTLGVL